MVTGLLAEYLRSKGFNAKTQWSIDLPHGRKGTPDLMLVNEGYFPGEAEWVGQEMFGWSQAQNYLQSPQAAGSFIVFYPKGLKKDVIQARLGKVSPETILSRYKYKVVFLRKDRAPDMNLSVSLDGLQNWLSDNIYRKRGPKTDINEVEVFYVNWSVDLLKK